MSKARYHFIVPAQSGPDSLEDPASLPAIAEAAFSSGAQQTTLPTQVLTGLAGLKTVRLPTNKKRPDAHISPYNAPSTIFDSSRHCLHGVIHTNGFGHLLRVNGHEGGGRKYSGTQMVDLWDTLCQGLGAKKITVEDVSSKNGMELRVLYSIACGYTWYGGKWGFTYGRGPFNMTEYNWTSAWRHVAAATLSNLLYDFEGLEPGVPAIVKRYRLPVCGAAKVRDLGTLFMRLLYLQARPKEARPFFDEKEVHSATEMMRRLDEERFHSMVGRGRGRGPGRGRGRGQGRGLKTVSQNDFHGESSKGQVGAVVPGKTKRQDRIHGSTDTTNSRASCTSLHGTRILWYCRTRSVWYQGRIVEQSSTPGSGSLYVVDFGNDLFAELDLANDEDVKFYDNNERPSFLDAKKKKDFTFGWDVENKERKCEQEKEKQVNPPVTKHVASSQQTLASPPRVVTKILRYKAHLSRPQDNIERARQLSRALKALFPAAKEYLGQGKTRKELDTAFEALVGDGVPKPTYRGEWWEYLYIILQWAQSVVDNLGSGEALNASRTIDSAINNDGKVIEIDVDVLHDLGLYPENWPIPLTAEGVRRSNVQANRSSGPNQLSQPSRQTKTPSVPSSVAPPTTTLPGDQDINDAVTGTGTGAGAGADTGADGCTNIAASETRIRLKLPENMPAIHLGCRRCRKPRLGCRECRARELEKLKVSGAVELVALIGADSCCGVFPGCPKCWRRALGAIGHPQFSGGRESDQAAFNGNTRPSRPSAAKREIYQDVERHVRRKTTHLGKGVDLKTKTREKSIPLLDPVKIRELVQSPPGPEELPESALALPLNSVLIDANLPNLKVPHCNVEGPLGTAILALCSAAASHKDLWLSPARLMTLAEQSLDTNRK